MQKVSAFLLLSTFCFLLSIPSAHAYVNPGPPSGFVNDFAGLLSSAEKAALEAKLSAFAAETGHEIAIATIKSLEGDTAENFAGKLFEDWKVGKKGLDNGVLVLVAREDRKMWIEVGYGLEGVLTDAQTYWIVQNEALPAFREGKYREGLDRTADKLIAAARGEVLPTSSSSRMPAGEAAGDWVWLLVWIPIWGGSILGRSKSWWLGGVLGGIGGVVVGFFYGFIAGVLGVLFLVPLGLLFDYIVSQAYARSVGMGRRPPWWIGGGRGPGSGGGFGGFGGGRSGGGGAGGSW